MTLKPSQWLNFGTFLLCLLFGFLVLPLLYALWVFLVVHTWRFQITGEQLIERKGVFSLRTDRLELYRIKDIQHLQPFLLRLVRKSTIVIISSDKTSPKITIPAISNGNDVVELLRMLVEKRRDLKGVKERDFE